MIFFLILKSLLLNEAKVIFTIDNFGLKVNLTTNKTKKFPKKSFFYTILGFTKSHSGLFVDIEGYIEKVPRTYKTEKPINITGNDKVQLKCDCFDGNRVIDVREPTLFSLALDKSSGHKNKQRTKN